MSIKEWIAKLNILNPKRVKIISSHLDTVDLEIDGKIYFNVIPKRPFPFTKPEFIIFYTADNHEIGILYYYLFFNNNNGGRSNLVCQTIKIQNYYELTNFCRLIKLNSQKYQQKKICLSFIYRWKCVLEKKLRSYKYLKPYNYMFKIAYNYVELVKKYQTYFGVRGWVFTTLNPPSCAIEFIASCNWANTIMYIYQES